MSYARTFRPESLPVWSICLFLFAALEAGFPPLAASAGDLLIPSQPPSEPFEPWETPPGMPRSNGLQAAEQWPSPFDNGLGNGGNGRRLDLRQTRYRGPIDFLLRDRPWIVNGPVVPEPMVFDMVRPMHARKGELEANVLGVVPMHRRHAEVDWAPEIEYAIADGFGVEFEFPFVDEQLEALKFAVQYTFDVGLDNRLIHGYHGIYEYLFDGQISEMTSLYLLGLRFNDTWSVMGMFGFRSSVLAGAGTHFTELLQNVGFFADLTDTFILGVETNMSHRLDGPSRLLIVPQAHWQVSDNWNLQFGFGLDASRERTIPIHAFRVVWER